ncbi:MAG: helicase-related protein [Candidatus Diapherotrites archaeon]
MISKKKYSNLKIKATISTGDFDSGSKHLSNYDLIFTTFEKLESLLNHRAEWLSNIGALIIDEIHELDSSRGPTIEIVVTKLRLLNPKLHILGLSATIPNGEELANWLNAELIESDYRPVKLDEGIYFDGEIKFHNRIDSLNEISDPVKSLCADVLDKKKQALVFCNTRKSSAATAKKLAKEIEKKLTITEKNALFKASEKALNFLESPTEQCKEVSELIKSGVCYHNAGLLQKQRTLIEDLFREGNLKVITATTTLSAGLNTPAFRVIIPQLFRYSSNGLQPIPVREYKQAAGRAGRPKYDSCGEAVLIARSFDDIDNLREKYIEGFLEPVNSSLGGLSTLRTILLNAISSEFIFDLQSCESFFSKTFYFYQYKEMHSLLNSIQGILKELNEMNFIQMNEKRFTATALGRRVSELFLDPLTANKLINGLALSNDSFYYLYLFSDTSEMYPYLSVPKSKETGAWEELQEKKSVIPVNVDIEMFSDPNILNKFMLAKSLNEWINESSEQYLMKEFNLAPGTLFNKLDRMDWLTYSATELAQLLKKNELLPIFSKLRKRLKYGVKEELIYLTELRGIGRVRARKLWRNRIQSIKSLKESDFKLLAGLLGTKIALQIKQQLKVPVSETEMKLIKIKTPTNSSKQKGLNEF